MEEKREVIVSKDFNKIKDVVFTNPELMSSDAKEKIKNLYFSIKHTQEEIYSHREKIRELENTLQDQEKEYQRLSPLFELVFETKEKEYVTNKSSIGIRGLGNDTLGRSSLV